MKMSYLLIVTFLFCLFTLFSCEKDSSKKKRKSGITSKQLDSVEETEDKDVYAAEQEINVPKINWNQEHFDDKLEPNEFTNLYCEKENAFNGIGSIQTITEVYKLNAWSSNNCTASLVKFMNEEFLLTAAHCVVDKDRRKKVPAGNMTFIAHHGCNNVILKWKSYVERIYLSPGAAEYFIKEGFDIRADHDWAILKLRRKSPNFIKKYSLNFEGDEFKNAANFGFGALQEPSGYPSIADGKTLIGYKQNVTKLTHNPILKLNRPTIVGMSGGPIFNLDNFQILGVNSHAIQKEQPDGDWTYSQSSLGAYPQIEELEDIIQQF